MRKIEFIGLLLLCLWVCAAHAQWGVGRAPQETPSAEAGRFVDIASRSRFAYRTNNSYTGRKYFPQPMCGGVAVFDFNGDGLMDIFFTNGAELPSMKKSDPAFHNCLLRNNGDGTFTDVTVQAGLTGADLSYCFGVAAGDYDNDGHTDLFLAASGRNTLYHNNGDGTFTDVTTRSGLDEKPADLLSVGGAWFDYDNDGRLDLLVVNYTFWRPESDQRCVTGGREMYCHPKTYRAVPQRLYRNLGAAGGRPQFEDVTARAGFGAVQGKGMGVAIADYDGDGWQDVFIANDTERNFLFLNQHDGTFKEVGLLYGVAYNDQALTVSAMGADAKDYDNDGWVDIFYNDIAGQIFALFKNARGKFFDYVSAPTQIERVSRPYTGWSCGFIDFNNDGWKDIYSANGELDPDLPNAQQHDAMFENVEGRVFVDVSAQMGRDFLIPGFQRGAAFADLNNDGLLDLVVTSLDRRPRLLVNTGSGGAHWLLLQLTGTQSNRDAVGAKVKVTTATGRTLYNHVTASIGFMSSSDRRLHFGLGREKRIRSIDIQWPSGTQQRLTEVAADQILRITEPLRSVSSSP